MRVKVLPSPPPCLNYRHARRDSVLHNAAVPINQSIPIPGLLLLWNRESFDPHDGSVPLVEPPVHQQISERCVALDLSLHRDDPVETLHPHV